MQHLSGFIYDTVGRINHSGIHIILSMTLQKWSPWHLNTRESTSCEISIPTDQVSAPFNSDVHVRVLSGHHKTTQNEILFWWLVIKSELRWIWIVNIYFKTCKSSNSPYETRVKTLKNYRAFIPKYLQSVLIHPQFQTIVIPSSLYNTFMLMLVQEFPISLSP